MLDDVTSERDREPVAAGSGLVSESGRVEAFSDGVLAIAITLLVLDLKIPEGAPGAVAGRLIEQWPSYVAYLASFIYVGVIWVNHHALFARISYVNSGLLWRNLALLLPVSVLPFPTATLAYTMQHGTHDDQLAALTLYGAVAVAMGLSWLVMFTYLDRRRDLLQSNVAAGFFRAERRRAAPGILGPLIAIAIGTVAPAAALIAVLFLPIFYGLTTEGWEPRRTVRRRTMM